LQDFAPAGVGRQYFVNWRRIIQPGDLFLDPLGPLTNQIHVNHGFILFVARFAKGCVSFQLENRPLVARFGKSWARLSLGERFTRQFAESLYMTNRAT
jgi:hypothetical protein